MIYSCTIKRNVSSNIQSYVIAENFAKNLIFGEKLTEILVKSYGLRAKFLIDLVSSNLFNHYTAIWSKYFFKSVFAKC